ncbi:MAG: hypothetical protein JWO05_905 [Gemmatimonadetes bacterium]|nr:hypothetical protein [Gemmatimonadota bacterium]
MSTSYPAALGLTGRVLRLLVALNLLMGTFILGLLIASTVAAGPVFTALGVKHPLDDWSFVLAMRAVMVLGLCAIPVTHFVLTRLLAIVDTVRAGDPFVIENAERLQKIAWAVLALSLLNIVVTAVATNASSARNAIDIQWSFDVTRWLAVLLLFVLARVFEHGARMRADLEGTI